MAGPRFRSKKKGIKEQKEEEIYPHSVEISGAKKVLIINCERGLASMGNSGCRRTVLKLLSLPEYKDTGKIVLEKSLRRVYDQSVTDMLSELSGALRTVSEYVLCKKCSKYDLWSHPLEFYYNLHDVRCRKCEGSRKKIIGRLKRTGFIRAATKIADVKKAYTRILSPNLIPGMIPAHIDINKPKGKLMESYDIIDVSISVFDIPSRPDMYYFVDYPELRLNNDELKLVDRVFRDISNIKEEISFDPRNMREEFRKVIENLLEKDEEKEKIMKITLRHTAGYGAIEPLLMDDNIQDVFVDSGSSIVHIVHSKWGECLTNIRMTKEEIDKLITRLRAISGRPLDASSPVLHAELEDLGIRVCGICQPSTYRGSGFAFRRRKSTPWTLPEFMAAGMLDSRTAGLLSFLVDGQSSMLLVGPRSSGKTSLLSALLLEIPQNIRIILIEDTPEIPVSTLQRLGFKIEHLKTEAFAKGFELSAEDALRTSLRLGESTLVLGEVRGPEAKSLFEAMRVGAAGNVVLGTIHGSSAYDTWDRVVNDLGVPSTSFKAVDVIVSTGSIRMGDDVKRYRRLLEVTEVRKDWDDDPRKRGFKKLLEYQRRRNSWKCDLASSSVIRNIANMKGLSRKQIMDSIKTRSAIKEALVRMSKKNPSAISAETVVSANNEYFRLVSKYRSYSQVYKEWLRWAKKVI